MTHKREVLQALVILYLALESVFYLVPAFKVGGFLELNYHQCSYIVLSIIQILVLQSSYLMGKKYNNFFLSYFIAHAISGGLYHTLENSWVTFGMNEVQYYYLLLSFSTLPYLCVLWFFRGLSGNALYKIVMVYQALSFILVLYYAYNYQSSYQVFVALSIGIYTCYALSALDACISLYARKLRGSLEYFAPKPSISLA